MRKLNTGITTEKKFADLIQAILTKKTGGKDRENAHWMRIETLTVLGVPDVNVCSQGREGWIELKVKINPIVPPRFQPMQNAWWMRAALSGRNGAVLCYIQSTNEIELWKPNVIKGAFMCLGRTFIGAHTKQMLESAVFTSCQATY